MTETATSVEERTSSTVQPGDLTAQLVQCREKAGLDIEQAAEELHLSTHILRALEAEDFAHLPEPPYVRGYLRGYSKLADIDAKELIRVYEALRGAKPDEIAHHFAPARPLNKVAQPAMSSSTLKFIGFGALVLLLGLFSMIPGYVTGLTTLGQRSRHKPTRPMYRVHRRQWMLTLRKKKQWNAKKIKPRNNSNNSKPQHWRQRHRQHQR